LGDRERYLSDFYEFCRGPLAMPVSEKPHLEMSQFVASPYSSNKLMLVPRGCWKTSLASTAYPLWRVLRAYFQDDNPAYRAIVDSATVRLSKFVIGMIESWCANLESLKDLFGELYDRKGKVDEGLSLKFRVNSATGIREPNFLASGVGAEKTGLHCELLVMDDLVTKANVATPTGREKVIHHYKLMQAIVQDSAKKGVTEQIIVGTRYHDADLYGAILKSDRKAVEEGGQPVFTTMIRQIVDTETGELFFPDEIDHRVIEMKKRKMGSTFYAQYMNDPNQETAPFRKEWLRWKERNDFPPLVHRRITVDPAFKMDEADRGDYAALVVMGWDRWHKPHIIDAVLDDQMTVGAFIHEFFRLAQHWQCEAAIIEADHQESLDILMRREMMERGFSFPIRWEKVSRNYGKMSRWLEIQPYAQNGGIVIAEDIPASTRIEIEDQWERAPVASHDDFMDALSLQMLYLPMEFSGEGVSFKATEEGETPVETVKTSSGDRAAAMTFGTLQDRFPKLRFAREGDDGDEYEPSLDDENANALMESFGAR
jgi:hypothetical protein